jgi:hypothetical protein
MVTVNKIFSFLGSPFTKNYYRYSFLGIALIFLWGAIVGGFGILIGLGGGTETWGNAWLITLLGGYPIMMGFIAKLLSGQNKNFFELYYCLMFGGIGFSLIWVLFIS